jgi:hypothetical protein
MPLALWTLLWLNFRAVLRKTGRQMKSARGIVFFIIGLGVLGLWIGPSIFLNTRVRTANHSSIMAVAPVVILLMTVLNLFTSAGERAVTFTPAEIDFLFAGPFSRRELLTYKLAKTALAGFISALIFGVILGRFGGNYFCRVVGIWLLFQFLQSLAMVIALLQETVGARLVTAGRRWVLLVVLAAAYLAVSKVVGRNFNFTELPSLPHLMAEIGQTWAGRILLAPFRVFAHSMLASEFLFEGLGWSAVAAGIDLAMMAVVLGLDANYLETAATVSARRYERLGRVRRSGLGGLANATSSGWKIPMLPWLGGTGPIIWRQLTVALRTTRTLLTILILAAVVGGVVIAKNAELSASIAIIIGISVYMNLFVSQLLRFDFRGDLDHLDVLRSLPLRPTAVAVAQLVTPALVLWVVQFVLLATVAISGHFPVEYLVAVAVFAVPLNLLALGVDNLMFLLFPFRPRAAVAGDMTMVGRNTIVVACRFILILIAAAIAAGVGAGVWAMTGRSWAFGAVAAWFPLAGITALIVWLIGLAFNRFDPSVHTPA